MQHIATNKKITLNYCNLKMHNNYLSVFCSEISRNRKKEIQICGEILLLKYCNKKGLYLRQIS